MVEKLLDCIMIETHGMPARRRQQNQVYARNRLEFFYSQRRRFVNLRRYLKVGYLARLAQTRSAQPELYR